jgi:hypothetical protein
VNRISTVAAGGGADLAEEVVERDGREESQTVRWRESKRQGFAEIAKFRGLAENLVHSGWKALFGQQALAPSGQENYRSGFGNVLT